MTNTRLVYLSAGMALGLANAVGVPLWLGYAGGNTALSPGFAPLLPYVVVTVLNGAWLLLVRSRSLDQGIRTRDLLLIAAFTRAAFLVTRYLMGQNEVDIDISIYFNYARELVQGHYPAMEYPQGALALFTAAFFLAGGELDRFRTTFPIVTFPFELITLVSLHWLGKRFAAERTSSAIGLLYAISPFTLVFWFAKYDTVPVALMTLGIALFVGGRYSLSGLVLGIGFLTKWYPGIPLAAFAIYLLRSREYRKVLSHTAAAVLTIGLPLALFWIRFPNNTTHTYFFHILRPLMGQSLLYLPVYALEPAARLTSTDAPWADVNSSSLSNGLATVILILGTCLPLLVLARRRVRLETALAVASLCVAMFLLSNRVYSPQYVLVLFAAYAVGFIAFSSSSTLASAAELVLLLLTLLNYAIWPLWVEPWMAISLAFFVVNLMIVIWLFYHAMRDVAIEKIEVIEKNH